MPQHSPLRTTRFDELYEEYHTRIFAYCRTRSRTAADGEDALSEVFLVAGGILVNSAARQQPVESEAAWMNG